MTQKDLFQTATSSQQDTHANRSALQDREKAKKMTATSGRTSSKLLHPKDPLGAFSKTFMGTSHWDSTLSSLTWNVKATPQGRLLFQLAVSTPRTKETESGLLPTPTTQDNPQVKGNPDHPKRGTTLGGYARMYPTPTASDYKNMDTANQQSQLAKVVRMVPTPAAADSQGTTGGGQNSSLRTHVKMYPTPRASEYKDCGPVGSKSHTHMKDRKYLCATVKEEDKPSGMLNPTWVEWLMGYPNGWTELKD